MQIRMLGPLEVRDDDGASIDVAGARLRTLLIVLAFDAGRLVPTAQLVDGIWGADPPAGAANALQALVSRLSRTLPGSAIESHPAGYRLAIDPDAVDVSRFERLVAAGRTTPGDAAATTRALREGLALWRGPALVDVADAAFFQAPRTGWKNCAWPQRRNVSTRTSASAAVPNRATDLDLRAAGGEHPGVTCDELARRGHGA